jgi:hypothetical protein
MKVPKLAGLIDRRILVNYTADPDIVQELLPKPFRPKTFEGKAIVGICLIRLRDIRPKGLPPFFGISSENGAHRIAIEWEENNEIKEGVYITRRDSSSWLNTLAGGRVFPGKHFHASFDVKEKGGSYNIGFESSDGTTINVVAEESNDIQTNSIFPDLMTASKFFENGSVGYSPGNKSFDGMKLKAFNWKIQPLNVKTVSSSFFEDENIFPKGSIQFDNALLMTEIEHEWESIKSLNHCP